MTTSAEKRKQTQGLQREIFHPKAVVVACAMLAATVGAYAQEAAKLDTVTVTGIRKGIEAAISVKKNSDSIVEAVSAEDIGKLPDFSIAESIARLPGLAAQRVAGRAQVISVRGLSPDFATTLLNGREMVSTGDNRSVEFDQYPAELLAGVTVYKTPDGGLVGQGLSGTIDMLTVRPLNFGSRVVTLNARGQRNSLGSAANASADGNRLSASYIDQYADRKVGLAIGVVHEQTPTQENQVGMYEPWKTDSRPGLAAGTYGTDGIKALRRTGYTKRDALMATLEMRPNAEWTSVLDVFASKAKSEDTANQFEVNLGDYNGGYKPGLAYSGVTVNGNGSLTGATASGLYPLVRGMYNQREDDIRAAGWNNKFKFNDITLTADLNYSKATRKEINLENNTQLAPISSTVAPLDTLKLLYNSNGFSSMIPGLNYSDPTKLFLRGTIYGSGYGKTPSVVDELTGFKLAANFPAPSFASSLFSDIDVGLNYADRSKKKHQPEGNINVGSQGDSVIDPSLQYSPVDLSFAGLGNIPAWNVPGAVAKYMTFNPSETSAAYLIAKAWNVYEKTTTGYLKANIETNWGGVPVRGNFGVQVIHTDQSSSANYWDGTAPAGSEVKAISDGKTFNDVLPSLNLAFSLGNEQTIRFALAQQMARPRVDQLRTSLDFGINTSTGVPGASGGNPRVDPWRANALDISYEKYFGNKAYVAAAAYYKDLKTYIYTQTNTYDFSKLIAGITPKPGDPPIQALGQYSAPYNGKGGSLNGVELSASLPLELVSPALKGFGILASASFNNSSVKIKDPESVTSVGDGEITLPGLSKQVYNLTAYYENDGFEARVSQRRRSDFIGEIGNFNGARTLRYVVGESIIDAQVGYSFNQGSFKGLGLLFQVSNLNDDPYRTYAGSKDRPLEYSKFGRTYLLGASYKF